MSQSNPDMKFPNNSKSKGIKKRGNVIKCMTDT